VFHGAEIIKDGFFAKALGKSAGDKLTVNSYHHQAVNPAALGNGVAITAKAFDGTIEAVEFEGERMILGVQFHPERMDDIGPGFFALLKTEAEKYRQKRLK
jgi:putative glutamine amidotransferase